MPKLFLFVGFLLSVHTVFAEVVLYSWEYVVDARCAGSNPLEIEDYPLRDEFARKSLMLFSNTPVKDLPNQQKHHIRPINHDPYYYQHMDCPAYLDASYQKLNQAMIDNRATLHVYSGLTPILWDTVDYLIKTEKRLYPSVYHVKHYPEKAAQGNQKNMIGFKKAINEVFADYPEMRDYWLNRIEEQPHRF